ncbi:Aquaporin TIP [Heracleum sosnowskyi]|uniref:Aquaporin TIP n=1 Tax=Heracleum sosnowskyi TaxID=360622 RepID=A0AAD8IX57_9APIA|nr:Aquaporin TIP [Heracleum sosnowskyi]
MASLKTRLEHCFTRDALRSYLAEFLSTFFFVFAAVGSSMSSKKLMGNAASEPTGLVGNAIATAFSLAVAVYISASVSGGHVNPAVTFGMAIGGHVSISVAIFYWISQILGSVMACLLMKVTTVGQHVPMHGIIPDEMTGFGASILEGVMTFALVYTVYAAADPRRGSMAATGPLAIGFIAGANVMASGPFTGGSMNPAYSFGAALIGGSFRNQAVYWIGPLVGAAMAALLYDNVVFPQGSDSVGSIGDGNGA